MSRYDYRDDYRREEQRRWDRAEDLRREQRRADMLAEERRREWLREEQRREDRRREDLRRAEIEEEDRRRRRAEEAKAQEEQRKRGISLLRDGFTEWGAAVLGIDPDRTRPQPPDPQPPSAARFDWARFALPSETTSGELSAPYLMRSAMPDGTTRLSWTAVAGAHSYALEESFTPSFAFAREVYRGESTEHVEGIPCPPLLRAGLRPTMTPLSSFRVKAIAPPGGNDSGWSNVV